MAEPDIIAQFEKYAPQERAAALSHWIYVHTSQQDESRWPMRVAAHWDDLDTQAKEFNIATIDSWARNPQVFDAWVQAVNAYRKDTA